DYLDVYLIHFISAGNWGEIKERKIIAEFEKFRAEGLIRAIGFSYHGSLPAFRDILAYYPWDMCQVQQNLLDVDKEVTAEAIRLAGDKGCALVIMEPLRGGGLAVGPPPVMEIYERAAPGRGAVEWAFRHVLDYPAVSTVLSGMTTPEQLRENIAVFSRPDIGPNCLSAAEKDALRRVKEVYESLAAVPCTNCEYCLPCPQNVNIPDVFDMYNEGVMFGAFDQPKRKYMFTVAAGQDASRCADCGECAPKCPQSIPISQTLAAAHEALRGWIE
ncbi:MAG: aldo/keto reductase, partial [Gracilibacteraceae bacterium]|nr:aldo/keto reductase [Gracilibacteraceae bacterium]